MSQPIVTAFTGSAVSSTDVDLNTELPHSNTMNVPTFDELHETYREYVRRRVCTLLHYRPDLIEDAIQDTWIKVWKYLPGLKSTANLKAWLWLVATNVVRDMMRRHKARETHYPSLEGILDHFDISPEHYRYATAPDPHEYIPEQVERHALRTRIWSKLSAKDKRTFAAYIENKPFSVQDLYSARRNFSERYKRAVARERREVAS